MPLDWLNSSIDQSVTDLIARKKRAKAIEVLRSQLSGKMTPSVGVRLQLVDLLIQAGRGLEAVPLLLSLADEFAHDGFVAKAVAVLKRIDKIDPDRADVESRLAALVQQQQRATTKSTRGPVWTTHELGIEAIAIAPAPAPAAEEPPHDELEPASVEAAVEETAPLTEMPTVEADSVTPEAPMPLAEEPLPAAEPTVVAAQADEGVPASTAQAAGDVEAAPDAETPTPAAEEPRTISSGPPAGVAGRIRGVFRRFLASLPGNVDDIAAEEETAAIAAAAADAAEREQAAAVAVSEVADSDAGDAASGEPVAGDAIPMAEAQPVAVSEDRNEPIAGESVANEPFAESDAGKETVPLEPVAGDSIPMAGVQPKPEEGVRRGEEPGPFPAPESLRRHGAQREAVRPVAVGEDRNEPIAGESVANEPFAESDAGKETVPLEPVAGDSIPMAGAQPKPEEGVRGGEEPGPFPAPESLRRHGAQREAVRPVAVGEDRNEPFAESDAGKETVPLEPVAGDSIPMAGAQPKPEMGVRGGEEPGPFPAPESPRRHGAQREAVRSVAVGKDGNEPSDSDAASGEPVAVEPSAGAELEPMESLDFVPSASLAPIAAEHVASAADTPEDDVSDEVFEEQLLDLVEDILHRPAPIQETVGTPVERQAVLGYAHRLVASPLFGALDDEELLAVIQGLRLHLCDAGDVIVTEGEHGHSLFVLASGAVRVFVQNPHGHNLPVASLGEGDFFGEISSLSGRPRTATVVATAPCELLELDKHTLDAIAASHPRVCDILESFYIARSGSLEAAAIRTVTPQEGDSHQRALETLEAHFGESRWDPRMRLRLANLLLRAGKDDGAVSILIGLADDLVREGFPEKAVAILKKVERLQRRNVEEVNLSPLPNVRAATPLPVAAPAAAREPEPLPSVRKPREATDTFFQGWLVDVVRDTVTRSQGSRWTGSGGGLRGYGPGLMASPLFDDFTEDELLAFIQGLRLLSFDAGDIVVTEGEPGASLFILTTGAVKVSVRNPSGRSIPVSLLREGAFFGEMSTLSGRPRSATVTAASPCELLEMDRATLAEIARIHPRIADILEEYSRARGNDPGASSVRQPR